MSNINISGLLIRNAVNLCTDVIDMLSASQENMQRKYKNAGINWSDSKYQQLGDIVSECRSSIMKTLHELNGCLVPLNEIKKAVDEYENINLIGNTSFSGMANNISVHDDAELNICGTLTNGSIIELHNVTMKNILYVKRDIEDTKKLRKSFNSNGRKYFLINLGKMDEAFLISTGLSSMDIDRIRAGEVPKGYNVHHKYPLDDSGDNSIENLILIKNHPYHIILTNYQNEITNGLNFGDSLEVAWPIPNGMIYTGNQG